MNNYAYLIKAKAKATEAKSYFCWFSAKSDSRAEREILNILEDAGINVGRGADHQLPIRTHWFIVDDLPEESVLDDTWCDRYELSGEDGITWQKITQPPVEEKSPVAEMGAITNSEEIYSNDENALFSLAEMPFRTQLLAQYMERDRHVYHISIPLRDRLSALEMDTDNNAIQDLILAAENVPDIKKYDMPGIWKFTSAFKKVFPEGKRYELGKKVQFAKLWFETKAIDRGILVKEWTAGHQVTEIIHSGDTATTERYTRAITQNMANLAIEIAIAQLYPNAEPGKITRPQLIGAKELVDREENVHAKAMKVLGKINDILDYDAHSIFGVTRAIKWNGEESASELRAMVRNWLAANGIYENGERSKGYPEWEEDPRAGRHSNTTDLTREDVDRKLAADRGEYVEGISDPNDPKWVHEDLTQKRQPEIAKVSPGMYSVESLIDTHTPKIADEEASSNVQVEENGSNEVADSDEISESEKANEHATGNAESDVAPDAVKIESGHHNIEESRADYVHVMVDLETMGKKSDAPIVSIGAVIFDPATGILGEKFYKVVSLESAVSWGAEIDPSTVIWWMKQSSEARSEIANDNAIQLDDALLQFNDFVLENIPGGRKTAQIWGNGATFDNTILRSSYELACIDCPWDYWNDRDVRTMVELGKAIGFDPKTSIPFEGEQHNALADAQHQARYVSAIWQRLIKN